MINPKYKTVDCKFKAKINPNRVVKKALNSLIFKDGFLSKKPEALDVGGVDRIEFQTRA